MEEPTWEEIGRLTEENAALRARHNALVKEFNALKDAAITLYYDSLLSPEMCERIKAYEQDNLNAMLAEEKP